MNDITHFYFMEYLRAVTPLVIGLIVAAIAWQQKNIADEQRRIAANKVKLDLFDRRFAVYKATNDFARRALGKGKVDEGDIQSFQAAIAPSRFLFDVDVNSVLFELCERSIRMTSSRELLQQFDVPVEDKRISAREAAEMMKWLNENFNRILEAFQPYLDFRKLR